jgi:hypothetical protein
MSLPVARDSIEGEYEERTDRPINLWSQQTNIITFALTLSPSIDLSQEFVQLNPLKFDCTSNQKGKE